MQPPYEEEDSEIPVPVDNDLELRIHDIFMAHDPSGNKTADSETLAIIIRALGLFPTNEEIREIVEKTQKKNQPGTVHLVSFLPFIAGEINKGRYKPDKVEDLLAAFQRLDGENRGYLTREQLKGFMTEYGEPLDEEEMEEMLEVAYDGFDKKVYYEEFVNKLWYKPKGEDDVFVLAQRIEAEKPPPPVESRRRFSQLFTSQSNLARSTSQSAAAADSSKK
ncbi:dynein regulatory complex protein 8-like [Coccinella septempunctata]|uniref:dynein regulatory complex protein 8-like n=1 Tax=Coccinella septempunctata TaxID=41139 RepID=UPI001D09145D|nr:dynein regulatory complex protein 8-like [Coccinella septempunctata]